MNVDDLALALGLGAARGARALARAVGAAENGKKRVVAIGDAVARAVEQAGHEAVRAQLDGGKLTVEDGAADALCASGLPDLALAPALLGECTRVLRDGGRVLLATPVGLVGRGPERPLLTAMFMHAGLVDIAQQLARGTAITIGTIRR
jgi:ubiquinone/menaquinone biosynthesis C-methylase UbiE